ncbi:hypothetical protein HS088_TW07G00978 [Tripterygium wilfordii]|uniref:HVA22-like protein n=2 Tax=Tripterygium wilfordii TaxID=458696 RepID=A0A7J7DGK6_TRIWF|nr:hypothetical protein HS088_TW07G00978 [Tripterygium wilfordii]
MSFGYAYPAYECFKEVENNNPDIERLLFWCQYWFLVAIFTICERVGDALISWLPMYSEAKLAFLIYLWYPRTKGTSYVYGSFFLPFLGKHQPEIDRMLLELRDRARNITVLFWQNIASYGQTRFLEILQYFSSQSSSFAYTEKQQQMESTNEKPLVSSHEAVYTPNTGGTTVSVQSAAEDSSASELQLPSSTERVQSFEDTKTHSSLPQETTTAIRSRRGIWRLFRAKDT